MNKTFKKVLKIILALLAVLVAAFAWYVIDDYDATDEAILALTSTEDIQVSGDDYIIFSPNIVSDTAIIFYPGGKVEEEAYAPMMHELARKSYTTFLVDMPLGLSVFDIDKANEIIENHPEITHWYIGGHSLGGSMAAIYAETNSEILDGLILLAAYSTADLSSSDLAVLAIYGSEDQVINQDKITEYRPMLPKDTIEKVIEGGNHAQFGHYGPQKGDGKATISMDDQEDITLEYIEAFIQHNQ